MAEQFYSDEFVEGKAGVWKTSAGELVQIHHMSQPYIIKVLQYIREHEERFELSRVYRELLRELKKRQKGA